jgi:hypothetical protein
MQLENKKIAILNQYLRMIGAVSYSHEGWIVRRHATSR